MTNSPKGKPSKIKQQQPNISLPHGYAGSFDYLIFIKHFEDEKC